MGELVQHPVPVHTSNDGGSVKCWSTAVTILIMWLLFLSTGCTHTLPSHADMQQPQREATSVKTYLDAVETDAKNLQPHVMQSGVALYKSMLEGIEKLKATVERLIVGIDTQTRIAQEQERQLQRLQDLSRTLHRALFLGLVVLAAGAVVLLVLKLTTLGLAMVVFGGVLAIGAVVLVRVYEVPWWLWACAIVLLVVGVVQVIVDAVRRGSLKEALLTPPWEDWK